MFCGRNWYVTTVSNQKTIWHLANYRACLDHVIKKWVCHICSSWSLNGSLGGKTDGFCQHRRFFFTVFIGTSMTEREKWEYAQNVVIKVCYSGAIIMSASKCCFWTKRGMFGTYVKTNFPWKEDESFWDTSFLLCHVYLMKIELTLLL